MLHFLLLPSKQKKKKRAPACFKGHDKDMGGNRREGCPKEHNKDKVNKKCDSIGAKKGIRTRCCFGNTAQSDTDA